jgi:hypothetical protein
MSRLGFGYFHWGGCIVDHSAGCCLTAWWGVPVEHRYGVVIDADGSIVASCCTDRIRLIEGTGVSPCRIFAIFSMFSLPIRKGRVVVGVRPVPVPLSFLTRLGCGPKKKAVLSTVSLSCACRVVVPCRSVYGSSVTRGVVLCSFVPFNTSVAMWLSVNVILNACARNGFGLNRWGKNRVFQH